MKGVIDRWEGEYAVLDIQGKMENVKKDQIRRPGGDVCLAGDSDYRPGKVTERSKEK